MRRFPSRRPSSLVSWAAAFLIVPLWIGACSDDIVRPPDERPTFSPFPGEGHGPPDDLSIEFPCNTSVRLPTGLYIHETWYLTFPRPIVAASRGEVEAFTYTRHRADGETISAMARCIIPDDPRAAAIPMSYFSVATTERLRQRPSSFSLIHGPPGNPGGPPPFGDGDFFAPFAQGDGEICEDAEAEAAYLGGELMASSTGGCDKSESTCLTKEECENWDTDCEWSDEHGFCVCELDGLENEGAPDDPEWEDPWCPSGYYWSGLVCLPVPDWGEPDPDPGDPEWPPPGGGGSDPDPPGDPEHNLNVTCAPTADLDPEDQVTCNATLPSNPHAVLWAYHGMGFNDQFWHYWDDQWSFNPTETGTVILQVVTTDLQELSASGPITVLDPEHPDRPTCVGNPVRNPELAEQKYSGLNGAREGKTRSEGTQRHGGTDILRDVGEPVYAMHSGYVSNLVPNDDDGWVSDTWGYVIVIRSFIGGQYYHILYAHQAKNSFPFEVGDFVNAGDVISIQGLSGSLGRAVEQRHVDPHVHIEVFRDDGSQDFLNSYNNTDRDDRVDPEDLMTTQFNGDGNPITSTWC